MADPTPYHCVLNIIKDSFQYHVIGLFRNYGKLFEILASFQFKQKFLSGYSDVARK